MKNIFFTVICILFIACGEDSKEPLTVKKLIPENTNFIVNTTNIQEFNDLENNPINNLIIPNFNLALNLTKNLESNSSLICFTPLNENKGISIISKVNDAFQDLNTYTQDLSYENISYKKSDSLYSVTFENIHILSNSENLIKQTIDSKQQGVYFNNDNYNKLSDISGEKNALFFDMTNQETSLHKIAALHHIKNNTHWGGYEFSMNEDDILLNGTTINKDSIADAEAQHLLSPQSFSIASVIPTSFTEFNNYTFDDFSNFRSVYFKEYPAEGALYGSSEFGILTINEERVIVIKIPEIDLNNYDFKNSETYRDIPIYSNDEIDFSRSFSIKGNLMTHIDEFLIFSDSQSTIENCIAFYQSQETLGNELVYTNALSELNSEANLLTILSSEAILSEGDAKQYPFIFNQFTFEENFTQINTFIKKAGAPSKKSSTTHQNMNIDLESELIYNPQLVTNHRTNDIEIVTQDVDNNLYLITSNGIVLWKKELDSKIQGRIVQVDVYKNNKLQLAFCTENTFYILDRNGNHLDNFPLKFKDKITKPLSVFDYDKKKRYRFLVTQEKELLMLDSKGKRVRGFTYTKASDEIVTQPKHFRIGTKDYIVFGEGNTMKILGRTGKTRIKPNKEIFFSNNDIFLFKNQFSTVNIAGTLITVNENGTVTANSNTLSENNYYTSKNNLNVMVSDNILNLNDKRIELDFGQYSRPEIFSNKNNTYIAVTDLEANKVYIYSDSGELLPKFPVYGNSPIHIKRHKNKTEFVVKGDEGTVLTYTVD